MKTNDKIPELPAADQDNSNLPQDLLYPASQDIYNHSEKVENMNPDDISTTKSENEEDFSPNEKDFSEDISGDDLDVPGSELDDDEEAIGNEDEENNFYSLGGDNHNNLEEDQGE